MIDANDLDIGGTLYLHKECHRLTYMSLNLIEQKNKYNRQIEKVKEKKQVDHFGRQKQSEWRFR